jgi:hypothetical protein
MKRLSEFLGIDQRIDEIEAEPQGHDATQIKIELHAQPRKENRKAVCLNRLGGATETGWEAFERSSVFDLLAYRNELWYAVDPSFYVRLISWLPFEIPPPGRE